MQLQLYGNKIWIFRKPIDFRQPIDGLSGLIVLEMQKNPQEVSWLLAGLEWKRMRDWSRFSSSQSHCLQQNRRTYG